MAKAKQKQKPAATLLDHPKNHRYSLSMALWHWQHWPGHQFITIVSIFVGFSLAALTTSPLFIEHWNKVRTTTTGGDDSAVTTQASVYYRALDGMPVASTAEANRWPVGVMIENVAEVRPQSGLGDASIIYETFAEGGTIRFLAVYDGPGHNVSRIGPVRSARPYYLEWISEYDGLYVHAGGSPQALQSISGLGIKDLNGIAHDWAYFWRDSSIAAPHNLFTNSEQLSKALQQRGLTDQTPTYRSWLFKDDAPLAERPTENKINPTISFSSRTYEVHYEYDTDRNTYRRLNAGVEQVDYTTKEPLRAKNIIVIRVPAETSAGEKGRINLNVTGEGTALVFRDGTVIEGTWKKPSRTDRTLFYDAAGAEIALDRGQTWVEVLPGNRQVTY